MTSKPVPDDLRGLADVHGVATRYRNERRESVDVDADVVIKVLGLLEVEAGSSSDRTREWARVAAASWADLHGMGATLSGWRWYVVQAES